MTESSSGRCVDGNVYMLNEADMHAYLPNMCFPFRCICKLRRIQKIRVEGASVRDAVQYA